MVKKGYNWRARDTPKVEIDDSSTKEIAVDIAHRKESYDVCNALVLPSHKRTVKNKKKKDPTIRLLSKKHRKQLEKVVERKQKKSRRAGLLEDLAKVQAPTEELKQYVSITTIQTKGLKRHNRELNAAETKPKQTKYIDEEATEVIVNAIKGSKGKRLDILENGTTVQSSSDPNTIGFDESSDEQEESDGDDEIDDNEGDKNPEEHAISKDSQLTEGSIKVLDAPQKIIQSHKNSDEIIQNVPLKNVDRKPAVYVVLNRTPEIQATRMKLPVLAEEQSIVEAINENPVVIITGETGSGKTTQVPQFLYEAGYARNKMIGVTEPRRVAAMSMSKRVAEEMNLTSDDVSYLIRFEGNVTRNTKIKFMTDGVLLKEVQSDFLLTKYSVIILDEAHERSVYTDILIGLLSRIVPLRAKKGDPLKLVIMSATLRVDDFVDNARLFKIKPPLIQVETRQFPVTIHFNRRTSQNYVIDAVKKAVKIHTRLPEGGILIFLTGQYEVNSVVRKLRRAFPYRHQKKMPTIKLVDNENASNDKVDAKNEDVDDDSEDEFDARGALRRLKNKRKIRSVELPNINLDSYSAIPTDDTQEDLFDDEGNAVDDVMNLDEDEDDDEDILELKNTSNSQPLWVLPLYSLLPAHKQARVFGAVPDGCRLCVVSTNVAETSLTIPHVKYVVDSGRCKIRLYDKVTGVSTYRVSYTSQASANQRAGRAGRMGPGHCYRLYSSAVFNDEFEKFSVPEIRRKPIDDLLLQMKVMNIQKVVNFPFPSPPDMVQLQTAERRLSILGILERLQSHRQQMYSAKPTALGLSVSAFPVAPRYGKMLAISHQHNLLKYTVCLVSALSVQELLIEALGYAGATNTKWAQTRRMWAGTGNSLLLGDPMVLIKAVGAAEYAGLEGSIMKFCEENGLRPKAIIEIRKLRQQLTNEIVLNIPQLELTIDPKMLPPSDVEAKLLRQIILAGMADQVAKKVKPEEMNDDEDKTKWRYAYKTTEMEDPIFMHSSCVLRKTRPEWVVYQEVYETNKMYMRGVTAIEPEWLPKFAPLLCHLSEPLIEPPPRYDVRLGKVFCHMTGTFGRAAWELPAMEVEFPTNIDGIKWFARFILDGQVCPKLKRFVPSLLSTPSSINKSWAKLLPRTEAITKALISKEVMSKEKLVEIWGDDRNFLLSAYQKWLPESAHSEVARIWPPL